MTTVRDLIDQSHANALSKGFWEGEQNIPEKLALIHSEVSEALEELRVSDATSWRISSGGKPEGFIYELADAVIRIADLCGYLGLDLETAIQEKHEYNLRRPAKHGKRF